MIVQQFYAWLSFVKPLQIIGMEAISPVWWENLDCAVCAAAGGRVWRESEVTGLVTSRQSGFGRQYNLSRPFSILFVLFILKTTTMMAAVLVFSLCWKGILIKNNHRQRTGCMVASGGLRMFDGQGWEKKKINIKSKTRIHGAEKILMYLWWREGTSPGFVHWKRALYYALSRGIGAPSPPVLQSENNHFASVWRFC